MSESISAASAWPWIPVVAAILGVTLGYFLSRIPARRERRSKAAGYLCGMDVECDYAARHARIYAEGDAGVHYLAPAYRMPMRFCTDGALWLAGEGFMSRAEIEAVALFVASAGEFNRCLDDIAAIAGPTVTSPDPSDIVVLAESGIVRRARKKAADLCSGEPGAGTAGTAQAAIRAAAARAGLQLA